MVGRTSKKSGLKFSLFELVVFPFKLLMILYWLSFAVLGLVVMYVLGLLFIWSKTRRICACSSCDTDMHLERTERPSYLKTWYGYLPLKAYHCRKCYRRLFVHKNTPGVEPARMSDLKKVY